MGEEEFIFYLGRGNGLTLLDVLLLSLCPIATMLGTMVSSSVSKISNKPSFIPATELPPHILSQQSNDDNNKEQLLAEHNAKMEQFFHISRRRESTLDSFRLPFVGLVLGLVIALYFVGAITESVTSLARILGLCVLLGYQAPILWIAQEKTLKKLIDNKIDSIVGK